MSTTGPSGVQRFRPMFGTGLAVGIVLLVVDVTVIGQAIGSARVRADWASTSLAGLIIVAILALVLHLLALAALSERLDRGLGFTEHSTLWRQPVRIADDELRAIRSSSWFITFDGGPTRRFVTGCGLGLPAKRLLAAYLPLVQRRPGVVNGDSLVNIYLALGMPPTAFGRRP